MSLYKDLVKKVSIPPEKKVKQKEYISQGCLPIVDQGKSLVGGYSNDTSKEISCKLPVIVFGDHTRAVKLIDFPFCPGADGIKVLEPKQGVLPKYLYYATQYLVLRLEDKGYARHYQHIEKKEIEIPEFDEQKRIVAKIEELISQLEDGVETLNKTKEQLKVYRQAVLQDAFKNCDKNTLIRDICEHVTDGDHMPPPKANEGIPFIMISNIENNRINWHGTAFVGNEYFEAIDSKRKPQKGDILYTVTGSFGIPVLVDFEKEFCFQRHIALLSPNERILQKYFYYALQAPDVFAQASRGATGTAQKTVGLGVLRKIIIPYVDSMEKQNEIATEIENRMSVCDYIEQTVNNALLQAEALRQSILKKAFEGEV